MHDYFILFINLFLLLLLLLLLFFLGLGGEDFIMSGETVDPHHKKD